MPLPEKGPAAQRKSSKRYGATHLLCAVRYCHSAYALSGTVLVYMQCPVPFGVFAMSGTVVVYLRCHSVCDVRYCHSVHAIFGTVMV
eukprot:3760861-Rhodomonas_salina.1